MPHWIVYTQHIGYGVGTGIASTIRRPIIIRTTGTLTGTTAGLSVVDSAAVDMSAVDFAAVDFAAGAEDILVVDMSVVDSAVGAEDAPVVATGKEAVYQTFRDACKGVFYLRRPYRVRAFPARWITP
jgi:hypothetical protein